jgi:molybdopterin-guanine dinucleotide biosynthesis protein MobB
VKCVHVIGRKNCGKTTLIIELVQHLTSRGWRVGTIKHTHHQHELDVPGKDSHKHRLAGAAVVGILSPDMSAVFWPPAAREDGNDRYEKMSPLFDKCDLILVEGDTQALAPKVEVWRAAASGLPYAIDDPSIRALITDDRIDARLPVWRRSDIGELASGVLKLVDLGGHDPVRKPMRWPAATLRAG